MGRVNWHSLGTQFGTTPNGPRFRYGALVEKGEATLTSRLRTPPRPPEAPADLPPRILRSTIPDVHDILEIPPRPFAVPLPRTIVPTTKRLRTAVVYSDTHVPYHDDKALVVVQSIVRDLQPDVLVHLGDLLDCYSLSRFSRDPLRASGMQHEIDLARVHLHQMRQLAPHAECWLLEGNHEDRLRRTIWDMPGGAAELARLTAFQKAMTWPELLGLNEIGWQFVSCADQSRTEIIPKLILKHGNVVRKWSGWSGKGEWEKYGKGGMSGHVHRLGSFYHRDHHGAHAWFEVGCTCTIDPEYLRDPDWQQGCAVVTWDPDTLWYNVELVYIQDGKAMHRDQQYAA